jgi:hypothetical protein
MPYLCRWVLCCFLSGWRQFGCGGLLLFLGCLKGSCVLEARLAFVLCYCGGSIFLSLIRVLYSVYLLTCRALVGHVFFYHLVCSFVTLRGSSHVHLGLLFTCRVVKRRFGFFLTWLGWLSDRINVVVGCSGSLASVLRCFRGALIASLWFVLAFFDAVWLEPDRKKKKDRNDDDDNGNNNNNNLNLSLVPSQSQELIFLGCPWHFWHKFGSTDQLQCLASNSARNYFNSILIVIIFITVAHFFRIFLCCISEASSCGICGGQSGSGSDFLPSTSVFLCLYLSSNASYSSVTSDREF